MMSIGTVKEDHARYVEGSLPLLNEFLINSLNGDGETDDTVWDGKPAGEERDGMPYTEVAWVFRYCQEQGYPLRIYKRPRELVVGFEFIDNLGRLSRYSMKISQLKEMQQYVQS